MNVFMRRSFPLLVVVLLVAGQIPAAAYQQTARSGPSSAAYQDSVAPGQTLQPLESLLQADGTLNLQTGFSGSLDLRGWTRVSEPDQPPHFVRASESSAAIASSEPNVPTVAGDENWDDWFGPRGTNGPLQTIAVSGTDVYVGGFFITAGETVASGIAKWDSTTGTWSALGSGVNGRVDAIAVSGSEMYVGGSFTTAGGVSANNIAKWNGSSWSALGSGVSGEVHAIEVSGSNVYVGGYFITAGGVSANNIAKWNGNSWSALGSGVSSGVIGLSSSVSAIAVSGSNVYVGGNFGVAGGVSASNVAKWNGSSWSALGSGVNGGVSAIAVSGTNVYVGGGFTTAGGVSASRVAKWNGSTWSALGSGVSGEVYAIEVSGSIVYVGGYFITAGGVSASKIARWNGSTWSALGSGVSGSGAPHVLAIAVSGSDVYAGGAFTSAGGVGAHHIARWNSATDIWSALGLGNGVGPDVSERVRAVAMNGSDVYAGGDFTVAGGVSANSIAQWNSISNTWSALGDSVAGGIRPCPCVYAILASGSDVYVGGYFTATGGVSASNIARWNGSSWSALGSGVNGTVRTIVVSGTDVYVGGDFTTAGGVTVNHVAKWDGGNWAALGGGVSSSGFSTRRVQALAVSGSDVYVGGIFTATGSVSANNIARWDSTSGTWSPLGGGVSGVYGAVGASVATIAVSGTDVYVGGTFTAAGGVSANYIARWDGSSWSALGSGVNSTVNAIAISGSDVYAGGTFTATGGMSANSIAKWDGSTWSALGSGVLYGYVSALTVSGSDVYVGGSFILAGGKPSTNFGLWHKSPPPPTGSISGQVTDPNAIPVPSAPVQACHIGGSCWVGATDAQGIYTATALPNGQFMVTAFPLASSSNLLPNTIGPLTIVHGGSLTGQDIQLKAIQTPPPGTSISPITGQSGGIPSVHWKIPLQLVTQGCAGGSASYQIVQDSAVIRSGPMTESSPPPGRYRATIEPLHPHSGYATIQITIQCPDSSTQTINFTIYIDPSGMVRTIYGTPVMSATVTLFHSDSITGTFSVVPNGDAIMSPVNRDNPDLTDAQGHFGWDVIAGFYKVRAEKVGCVSPADPEQSYVESDLLIIPPPVTDLDLRLDCGEKVVYLPLIQR